MALVAVYLFAVVSPSGQALDAPTLGSFAWSGWIGDVVGDARTVLTVMICAGALAAIGWASIRRRFLPAALSLAALVATYLLNFLLRDFVLVRPDYGTEFGYAANTFPSGHTALAAAGVAVILALLPVARVTKWVVGLLGAVVVLVAVASVSSYAHRGSDVVAGILLAGVLVSWIPSASTLGRLRPADPRWLWLLGTIVGALVLRFLGAALGASVGVELGVAVATVGSVVAVTAAVLATAVPDPSRVFP